MNILFLSILAWLIAQSIKVLSVLIFEREFKPSLLTSSGGMPSAHSAFVSSVATQIGLIEGFDTAIFALSAAFASVVIYDAYNVRYSVGIQGRVLNQMIDYVIADEDTPEIQKLKEVLGHTPLQVFFGVLLGILHILVMDRFGFVHL